MDEATSDNIETIPVDKPSAGKAAWLPAVVAMVLAPAITWAVAHFVLLPELREAVGAEPAGKVATAAAAPGDAKASSGHSSGDDLEAVTEGYRMENVVVNLAGTMGTRYLKASFMITGANPDLIPMFDAARPQIGDVTLAVLSGLTLADLEEPGSKNVIRERLVDAYNQVFGGKVAENLYFSEFVVQ
jgi:flagellar protein FliL